MSLVSGPQLRAARAMVRMEQGRLAELAGVTPMTVHRLEAQEGRLRAHTATVNAIQRALEAAGVIFINSDEPGVRMRLPA